MQQQHPAPAHPMGPMGAVPPTQITTEQIQKYLDENKQLILAILDNQNLGRLAECAQYQAQLQKNLLYLAAIADAQPQSPPMRPQMTPHATMPQPGGPFMQQVPIFPPKTPMHFTPQQIHELQQQQQLHHQPHMMPFQAHMGVRPVGGSNEMPSAAPQGMSETMPQRGSTPSSSVDAASEQADSQKKSMDAQPSENPKRPGETKTP